MVCWNGSKIDSKKFKTIKIYEFRYKIRFQKLLKLSKFERNLEYMQEIPVMSLKKCLLGSTIDNSSGILC